MNELSFIDIIFNASLLVQIIMLLLLSISLFSWTLIFGKDRYLRKVRRAANQFEDEFLKGKDLTALYNRITSSQKMAVGMESIFITGYAEFIKLRKQKTDAINLMASTERAMRATLHREMDQLDEHLATLASVGSVSPYIGLFGTVWGIMHSFHALGGMSQVTLAMVAPGISEALIATAMGLFAAIPAVLAHNSYVDDIDRLTTRYDTFLDDFTNLLQRQATANVKT